MSHNFHIFGIKSLILQYHQDLWAVSANVKKYFGKFKTHSFTNFSIQYASKRTLITLQFLQMLIDKKYSFQYNAHMLSESVWAILIKKMPIISP